jgi:hypothetical protein
VPPAQQKRSRLCLSDLHRQLWEDFLASVFSSPAMVSAVLNTARGASLSRVRIPRPPRVKQTLTSGNAGQGCVIVGRCSRCSRVHEPVMTPASPCERGRSSFGLAGCGRVRANDGTTPVPSRVMTQLSGEGSPRRARGRLAFAQMKPEVGSLFSLDQNRTLLERGIVAGTSVERHHRVWHMGQRTERDGHMLGRLGFTNANAPTEVWDEARKDFIDAAFPNGCTSPFAIRISDLTVAFQLRRGQIKFKSFAGAMQALLREATGDAWRVDPIVKPVTFERWRSTVERVVSMSFTLGEPNPGYKGRPLIKEAIADARAQQLRVIATADPNELEGLDTDAAFLSQAIQHVEKGYGRFRAVGERTDDEGHIRRVKFEEEVGETDVVPVGADPETGEVSYETLTRELDERRSDGEQESEQQGIDD